MANYTQTRHRKTENRPKAGTDSHWKARAENKQQFPANVHGQLQPEAGGGELDSWRLLEPPQMDSDAAPPFTETS